MRAAFRLGLKQLRGGFAGFRIFIACIALGVAAISGVGSFANALVSGLTREGAVILGADLSLQRISVEANAEEQTEIVRIGRFSTLMTTRSMVRSEAGEAVLAEIKAVEVDQYPLYGALITEPAGGTMLLKNGVLVETALLARLDLKIGDTVLLGDKRFTIEGVIRNEPDRLAGGVGFGPRLMMDLGAFRTSGLLQPGSLAKWHYQLVVPPQNQTEAGLAAMLERLKAALPNSGFDMRSRLNASPQLAQQVNRFAQFLTLVSLTALLIGGVGVASSVANHLDRRRDDIATLKTLGATGGFIITMEMTQILIFTAFGVALGLMAGASLPFIISYFFGSLIPLPLETEISVSSLSLSALFGFLVALTFSIVPLSRARAITVASLFRDRIAPLKAALRGPEKVMLASFALMLLALAVFSAYDKFLALMVLCAIAALFCVLIAVGWLCIRLVRALPHPNQPMVRAALANLHRPGNATAQTILALGLGLTLAVVIVLTDSALRHQLNAVLPQKAPSFFFADIPAKDGAAFETLIKQEAPSAVINRVPMLRGRITALNGVPSEQVKAADSVAWALSGDRGITYAATKPEGAELVEGQWWAEDYTGPNLVSLDERIAKGMSLKIGDTLTVNVLGRPLTATIANLRRIQWDNMGINFILVFSPAMFKGAPHASLSTVTLEHAGVDDEIRIVKAVAKAFPSVTTVRVKEALESVDTMGRQIAVAVRVASLLTLFSAILVLGGAVSASLRARLYDAVVLKTLGATRLWLLGAYLVEFSLLGLMTALVALTLGTIIALILLTQVMKIGFIATVLAPLGVVTLALVLTLCIGLFSIAQVFNAKPARILKSL